VFAKAQVPVQLLGATDCGALVEQVQSKEPPLSWSVRTTCLLLSLLLMLVVPNCAVIVQPPVAVGVPPTVTLVTYFPLIESAGGMPP
jgi:hypothetical protein